MDYRELLSNTQEQIRNCDNKASLLISAVGIVFGFSLFTFDLLKEKISQRNILVIIGGIIYLLSFLLTVVILIAVIYPRGRNKKEKEKIKESPLYFEDIYANKDNGDITNFLNKDDYKQSIIDQISICARIAHIKTLLVKIACFVIIFFVLSLLFFVIVVIL